ncbi:MAG TPA: hypothetical protein VFV78_08610 [Vicinamibacterales bacterium]|nr:hypothetical protein [Vicinamibacterales bacterium]
MTIRFHSRITVMKPVRLAVSLCLAVAAVACGDASSDSAAGAGNASAPAASPGAVSTSASRVVPHEKLVELLPNIPGFKRESDVQATTDTSENVSRVQLDYIEESGTAGLSVELMDVAGNAVMLEPIKALLKLQGTRQSAGGTEEKVTVVGGYPAVQEWTAEANNGSMSVLLAGRFLVKVTGSSVAGVGVIAKALEAIDLKKIEALK